MLPFQQLVRLKFSARGNFFVQLLSCVFVAHCLCLFLFFFIYKSEAETAHVVINKELVRGHASVVYIPWMKRAPRSNAATKTKLFTPLAHLQKTKLVPKTVPKPSTVMKSVSTKEPKKAPVKQIAKKIPEKKLVPKDIIVPKKDEAEKQIVANNEPIAQPAPRTESVSVPQEEVQYIGREEKAVLDLHEVVTQQIIMHWQPPAGFVLDEPCIVSFIVDWEGKPQNIEITRSSGMPVIDLAAREAVQQCVFDVLAHGKTITVELE